MYYFVLNINVYFNWVNGEGKNLSKLILDTKVYNVKLIDYFLVVFWIIYLK